MIEKNDILSMAFLKKEKFTGSYFGMRYQIEKIDREEVQYLLVTIWPEPFSFQATDDALKQKKEFDFTEEGRCLAIEWLNNQYKEQINLWDL